MGGRPAPGLGGRPAPAPGGRFERPDRGFGARDGRDGRDSRDRAGPPRDVSPAEREERALGDRARDARRALEAALAQQARASATAVWDVVAARADLCETVEQAVRALGATLDAGDEPGTADPSVRDTALAHWAQLAALPAAWEQRMVGRRDAALAALGDAYDAADFAEASAKRQGTRAELLLELEMRLGLDSPPDQQAQRLAVQVRQLRSRFKEAGRPLHDIVDGLLLDWFATAGTATAQDRSRISRIREALKRGVRAA
jgi:hypothetical protein